MVGPWSTEGRTVKRRSFGIGLGIFLALGLNLGGRLVGAATTRPTPLGPANDSAVALGDTVTFTWSAVAGAGAYFFEYSGRTLRFTNPNDTRPDSQNGYFGRGGGLLLPGGQTSFIITVGGPAPAGTYQWRVIALSPDANVIGTFSDASTITLGQPGQGGPPGGSLPACDPAAALTVSPLAMSDFVGITPLGNLNPPSHTLPTSHMYFYLPLTSGPAGSGPLGDGRIPPRVPVVAPGRLALQSVSVSEKTTTVGGQPVSYTEYALEFGVCGGLSIRFDHVGPVSERIAAAIQGATPRCQDYTTGGVQSHFCSYDRFELEVSPGEQVAFTSGRSYALDLGASDGRSAPLPFVHPERYQTEARYNRCPLDVFEPTLRGQLLARVGQIELSMGGRLTRPRTAEPICGTVNQDIPGTAQGGWFADPQRPYPEDNDLALARDEVDPSQPVFSVGNTVPGLASGTYAFTPRASGLVNRDIPVQGDPMGPAPRTTKKPIVLELLSPLSH